MLGYETARKELFILSVALLIEVTRMLLVDIFVLRDYFSGRSYSIFRARAVVAPQAAKPL